MLDFLKKHPAFKLFLLCYIFCSLAIIGTEINKIDVRFAFIMRDLMHQPFSIFPRINGIAYADYFSPYFYLALIPTLGGNFVNLWSIAQLSILLVSLTLATTYRIGERLSPKAGIWAVLLLVSSFEYIYSACQFGIDLPIAVLAVVMLDQLMLAPDKKRTIALWMLFILLAILFRGSLGLVVFGCAVAGWLLFCGNVKRLLIYGVTGILTAALGVALIVGCIFLEGGKELFEQFFVWQVGKRMAGTGYFDYIIEGFLSFLPGSLIVLGALVADRKNLKHSPVSPLLGFLLLPVLVLSIPGGKHLRYLVPLLSAPAIAGGYALCRVLPPVEKYATPVVKYLKFLPLVCLAAIPVLVGWGCIYYPASWLPWINWTAAAVIFGLLWWKRDCFTQWLGAFALLSICLLTCFCALVIPLIGTAENSSAFVQSVETFRAGKLYIFDEDPDHEALKYYLWMTPAEQKKACCIQENHADKNTIFDQMYVCKSAAEVFPTLQANDIIIVHNGCKEQRLRQLLEENHIPGAIIVRGQMGHKRYCAFQIGQRSDQECSPAQTRPR